MSGKNKIVFITGATAGIGASTALKFAENNYDIIITGRRKEKLDELTSLVLNKFKVKVLPLCFDVRNLAEVEKSINSLNKYWNKIDVLVNNAGLAVGLNPIDKGIIDDWERMIDTNIKGLLYVSRSIIPIMIENGYGHIVNIGSIAGRDTYPNGNVYCGTKAAVDAITKGMRMDLLDKNIKVTLIEPGAVETEFSLVRFKGNIQRAKQVYKGFEPLKSQDVANVIYFVCSLPPHVNINDLLIMPTAQASASLINKESQ